MDTEPLERVDEHQSGETPEDVAILYSWANLQGAKYRDFSANRREYRAQMRHRAAEQLRLMELRAQSEAEAAAAEAEAGAAAAHAEADAATVKLAVSRSMPTLAPEEILREKEVEDIRRSSLREAAQQARRAAAERLEAARRAEAAALADSIARREEREIAEAQASALRQAAQYHESELRSRQMMAQHPDSEDQVPGRITDPYSPQILPEGEYYDGPGTPPSELEASRFRTQREYIERSTGAELPKFKMPPVFDQEGPHRERAEFNQDLRSVAPESAPRRLAEMDAADREYYADRQLREERNASILPKQWIGRQEQAAGYDASVRERTVLPRTSYGEPRDASGEGTRTGKAEVVSRIPIPVPVSRIDAEARSRGNKGADSGVEEFEPRRKAHREFDGSLVNDAADAPRPPWMDFAAVPERQEFASDNPWQPRRSGSPQATARPVFDETQRSQPQPPIEARGAENAPRPLYASMPRPSGSWLREIYGKASEDVLRREPRESMPVGNDGRVDSPSPRPSVEATYPDGQREDALAQADRQQSDKQPSGFRPPWLTQAQAPRQSGPRRASGAPISEKPAPQWLYPQRPGMQTAMPAAPEPVADEHAAWQNPNRRDEPTENYGCNSGDSLQASREKVASRWFALKGVFAGTDAAAPAQAPREKSATPMIAVYSLAGGTGKTSLVATLGRALSSLGEKVLLTDTTSHGLLPFYFGASELASGVVRTFTPPSGSMDAPVFMVSYDLDALQSDQTGRDGAAQSALLDGLVISSQQVNRVLLDLDGHCGWLIERLARLKPTVLVPVAADMNSIVSLQAVERKFAAMQSADGEPLRPVYLLNQFDASLPLHLDLREVLRQQLGDRLLPLVIRRAAGVSEALAEGMTIVDYDPDSPATQDFLALANWIRAISAPGAVGLRNLRWSER